jgi:hypothetical protein
MAPRASIICLPLTGTAVHPFACTSFAIVWTRDYPVVVKDGMDKRERKEDWTCAADGVMAYQARPLLDRAG